MRRGLLLISFLFILGGTAWSQSSAFTYQGKLTDASVPANGPYDLVFRLFDSSGVQIGGDLTKSDVQVNAGIFTVSLDFGASPFTGGSGDSLEIAVRPGSSTGAFITLTPRQPLTSSPYAIKSTNTASADSLSPVCILCVTDSHIQSIDGGKVTGVVANAAAASTAVNVTGIVQIANGGTGSVTKNFVDLSTDQSNISGNKTFTGAVGVTGGTGVFNGNGSGLTNLNGANIAGGTVTTTQLSADAVPNSSTLTLLASLRWDVLKGQRNIGVGSAPSGMTFDGSNLWVVNINGNSISKIRASDGTVLNTFPAGAGPQHAAFDGTNIWITDFTTSNNVQKMRASDGVIIGTFSVPTFPSAIVYDGANLWIQNGNNVTKLRASDGAVLGTFAVGNFPLRIVFDGANVWVANFASSNVTKIRAGDGVNLGTFAAGGSPSGITFDGSSIWLATPTGLTKLRLSDGANIGSFPMATGASDVAFDGSNLWAISGSTAEVFRIRASDGVVLGTYAVGTSPKAMAFDGRNMWVTNQGSNSVTILPPAFPQP